MKLIADVSYSECPERQQYLHASPPSGSDKQVSDDPTTAGEIYTNLEYCSTIC
jgi:hypothetical protein